MHKLGLKLWSTNTDAYLREAARLYANRVFDYLELYFVPGSLKTSDEWHALGIPMIVHAPHSAHAVNLAAREKREANLAVYEDVRRFADALGAPKIVAHGGAFGELDETIRQLNLIGDNRILVENKPYLPIDRSAIRLVGSTPDEIGKILSETGLGFCLDFGHMIASANAHKADWRDYLTRFLAFGPAMYHVSDMDVTSDVDQHWHFGTGTLPIGELMGHVPCDSIISIEVQRSFGMQLNDFERDVAYLRLNEGDWR